MKRNNIKQLITAQELEMLRFTKKYVTAEEGGGKAYTYYTFDFNTKLGEIFMCAEEYAPNLYRVSYSFEDLHTTDLNKLVKTVDLLLSLSVSLCDWERSDKKVQDINDAHELNKQGWK